MKPKLQCNTYIPLPSASLQGTPRCKNIDELADKCPAQLERERSVPYGTHYLYVSLIQSAHIITLCSIQDICICMGRFLTYFSIERKSYREERTVRSQTICSGLPPPTAYPATIATTGLGSLRICICDVQGGNLVCESETAA